VGVVIVSGLVWLIRACLAIEAIFD